MSLDITEVTIVFQTKNFWPLSTLKQMLYSINLRLKFGVETKVGVVLIRIGQFKTNTAENVCLCIL